MLFTVLSSIHVIRAVNRMKCTLLRMWTSSDLNMQRTQKLKGEVPIRVVLHYNKLTHSTPGKQLSTVI